MNVIARSLRSGLVEAEHQGAVAAATANGLLVARSGNVDRRFFARSAIKPFQATVALECGAVLDEPSLAVACASHGGYPAHVAYVRKILAGAGLDDRALQTPPAWPMAPGARDRAISAGHRTPRSVWHNCSGKHAAWLSACRTAGWPIETYLHPDHPLQVRVAATIEEATGEDPGLPGVDGCGAPTWQVSTSGLARAFARFGADPRFGRAWLAMHRYPALASENGRIDQQVATWLDAAAKVGAEGCLGVAMRGGPGVAVKAWDGSDRGVAAGIVGALEALGLLVGFTGRYLGPTHTVLGGGRKVGDVVSAVEFSP